MNRSRLAPALCTLLLLTPAAIAEEAAYDFADPKGVNGVTFVIDSELEPIVGIAGGVTGTITFDLEQPETFAGSISVATDQIMLVNNSMTDVMRSADWLNIGDNADLTVTFGEVVAVDDEVHEEHGDDEGHEDDDHDPGVLIEVEGTLTFGGVSLDQTFEVHATVAPEGATERGAGQGDLLVLRSEFVVSRYDLGIKEDMGVERVADEIWVIVPIVGYAK